MQQYIPLFHCCGGEKPKKKTQASKDAFPFVTTTNICLTEHILRSNKFGEIRTLCLKTNNHQLEYFAATDRVVISVNKIGSKLGESVGNGDDIGLGNKCKLVKYILGWERMWYLG